MKDWRERNAEPYMYFPLVVAWWHLRRETQAAEVSQMALGRGYDQTNCLHQLWLVVDHLAKGRLQEAAQGAAPLRPTDMNDYYRPMCEFVQLACQLLNDNDTSYSQAKALLKSHRTRSQNTQDKLQARIYHFVCWRLAEKHNLPMKAFW